MGTQSGHKRIKQPKVPKRLTRVLLTINKADTLTPEDRYKIVNWLHAVANILGHDDHGALPKTYKVWMLK